MIANPIIGSCIDPRLQIDSPNIVDLQLCHVSLGCDPVTVIDVLVWHIH